MAITVNTTVVLRSDEIEEIGHMFQKEVNWRKELDEWNERYKAQFGSIGENYVDDNDQIEKLPEVQTAEIIMEIAQPPQPTLTQDQIRRKICDETFK